MYVSLAGALISLRIQSLHKLKMHKTMFKLMGKKIITISRKKMLNWPCGNNIVHITSSTKYDGKSMATW